MRRIHTRGRNRDDVERQIARGSIVTRQVFLPNSSHSRAVYLFCRIFIDFSFVKQKQEIQEQARMLKEQAKAASSKNVWPQFNKPN